MHMQCSLLFVFWVPLLMKHVGQMTLLRYLWLGQVRDILAHFCLHTKYLPILIWENPHALAYRFSPSSYLLLVCFFCCGFRSFSGSRRCGGPCRGSPTSEETHYHVRHRLTDRPGVSKFCQGHLRQNKNTLRYCF